jgi:hypothetical protein
MKNTIKRLVKPYNLGVHGFHEWFPRMISYHCFPIPATSGKL